MGTVSVPKNMAQLAAVMTPQQQVGSSSGAVGGSSVHHRIGPNDSLPLSRLEDSMALDAGVSRSAKSGSAELAFGLGQIPERSEQNSPAHEGALTGTRSQQSPLQEQQQQYLQQSHRYLLRSGSDSTGRSHLRSQGRPSKGSLQTEPPSNAVEGREQGTDDLTPLQRMQQQLQMGQTRSLLQQQQQSQQYHFGYPQSLGEGSQSGTATSDSISSSDTGSGSNSNSSSQLEFQSTEHDFVNSGGMPPSESTANRRMFQRMDLARRDSPGSGGRSSGSITLDTFEEDEEEDAKENRGRFTFEQDHSDEDDDDEEEEGRERANPDLSVVDYSGEAEESLSDESHPGIMSESGTSSSLVSSSYSSSIGVSDSRDENAALMQGEESQIGSLSGIEESDSYSLAAPAPSSSSLALEEEPSASLPSPPLTTLDVVPQTSSELSPIPLTTVQEQNKPEDYPDNPQTLLSAINASVPPTELVTTAGNLRVLPKVKEVDEDDVEGKTILQENGIREESSLSADRESEREQKESKAVDGNVAAVETTTSVDVIVNSSPSLTSHQETVVPTQPSLPAPPPSPPVAAPLQPILSDEHHEAIAEPLSVVQGPPLPPANVPTTAPEEAACHGEP